jgi:hypothetical protein
MKNLNMQALPESYHLQVIKKKKLKKEWNPFDEKEIIKNYSKQKIYETKTHLKDIQIVSPITQEIDGVKGSKKIFSKQKFTICV